MLKQLYISIVFYKQWKCNSNKMRILLWNLKELWKVSSRHAKCATHVLPRIPSISVFNFFFFCSSSSVIYWNEIIEHVRQLSRGRRKSTSASRVPTFAKPFSCVGSSLRTSSSFAHLPSIILQNSASIDSRPLNSSNLSTTTICLFRERISLNPW